MKRKNILTANVHIISNRLKWDKAGNLVGWREPIIHSFAKDEGMIKYFPEAEEKIKGRPNIVLLGDSLGDVKMHKGIKTETIIKVGFLNDKAEEELPNFKQAYDVILTGDASFAYVNKTISEIV